MKITKRLSEAGASDEALSQLEAQLGFTLPNDYRQFMAEINGGRPVPSGFVFATADGKSDSAVRYFLTLDAQEERYTIQEFLDRYSNRIPKKTLPIACDSFGNLVLLDAGSMPPGAVCFWNHEKESMDEPAWDNITLVAASFTDFVNGLH